MALFVASMLALVALVALAAYIWFGVVAIIFGVTLGALIGGLLFVIWPRS